MYKYRPAAGSRGGGALSVLLRSHTFTRFHTSPHMLVFARPNPVRSRWSKRQQNHGWSDPAGGDSSGCNPILTTVDVSCSRDSHISSPVLLGDKFSGFVKFRKPFRDFNRLIPDMWLYSWCFVSAACVDLSVRLAAVLLMSGGARPASMCRLSILVSFRQPVMKRQQS